MYFLYVCSSSPDLKDQCSTFSIKNGGVAGAMELKRPGGTHCHGPGALVREDRGDKHLAKKKLYMASAVCLVFMIGEVIGKDLLLKSKTCFLFRVLIKASVSSCFKHLPNRDSSWMGATAVSIASVASCEYTNTLNRGNSVITRV